MDRTPRLPATPSPREAERVPTQWIDRPRLATPPVRPLVWVGGKEIWLGRLGAKMTGNNKKQRRYETLDCHKPINPVVTLLTPQACIR